jgi:FkbM family methyltransferase
MFGHVVKKYRGRIDGLERRIVALENGSYASNVLGNGTAREVENFTPRRSYSIEAEDLLADTIFNAVLKFHHAGTYLDIGAAHPVQHSNTYLFYERGWRGICVEPNPEFYALYKTYRSHDTALNVGIAPKAGTLQYHRFAQPLINGFFGQDLIDRHIASGETYLGSSKVPCLGIGAFLREKIKKPIDFLNIDVETLDASILAAWDWNACRPAVICAEIHTSGIRSMLDTDVSRILEAAGYRAMCRGWLSAIFVENEKL